MPHDEVKQELERELERITRHFRYAFSGCNTLKDASLEELHTVGKAICKTIDAWKGLGDPNKWPAEELELTFDACGIYVYEFEAFRPIPRPAKESTFPQYYELNPPNGIQVDETYGKALQNAQKGDFLIYHFDPIYSPMHVLRQDAKGDFEKIFSVTKPEV